MQQVVRRGESRNHQAYIIEEATSTSQYDKK